MFIKILATLFNRDLGRLRTEIGLYKNEEVIWQIENEIKNSGGNLCLHLIGNLNTYIGAAIGKSNYTRQRDLEFSLKGITKLELLRNIDETIMVVSTSFDKLTQDDLEKDFPVQVFEEKATTMYVLVHLATHLNYHLGQINYHRRFLDK